MLIDTVPEGRSPRPEQRRSASDRPNFVKHSRSEPALSTHDECPVSRQAQPGKIESDQAVALQCAANFGLVAIQSNAASLAHSRSLWQGAFNRAPMAG